MFGKDIVKHIEEALLNACKEYCEKSFPDFPFPEDTDISLQLARDPKHGDFTSNIAMRMASLLKTRPDVIGKGLAERFEEKIKKTRLKELIERVDVKGGFINFKMGDGYYHRLLFSISRSGKNFGRSRTLKKDRINLEFVSANPTGPLTVAHGRQAAIGDALSRILRFSGFKVTNEYYLNDMGRQINLLGESVRTRYLNILGEEIPMPEDGYMGSYIIDIAKEIEKKKGRRLKEDTEKTRRFFREYAVRYIMRVIEDDLNDFGVRFDAWTPQSAIENKNKVEKALEHLRMKGHIYEKEGAVWFASSRFGDDKDRVVVKSDGSFTYLGPDIAYHLDKYERGHSFLVDILGPDHHGYISRMKAAAEALGYNKKSLNILIVQLVTLLRGKETISMSTRKGEFISLREIMDELGRDVTRFFFLSRRLDSHLDFDIELAKKESADNPVFYMQYAHARICSIKRFSRKNCLRRFFTRYDSTLLRTREERVLIRKLSEFPFAVQSSAAALEPNKIIVYLNELARLFHSFYTECRVISDDRKLSKARLYLVECVKIVLSNGLNLLNITLPEKM